MDHFIHSLISESKAKLSEVAKSRITIVIAHNFTNEFKTCFLRLFLRSARTILLDRAFIFTRFLCAHFRVRTLKPTPDALCVKLLP